MKTKIKTPTSPSPTNLVAKNLLAKLMATENLIVEHDSKAKTASFNMETRVLTLPVWKDLNADTLDMLIGHEVSHALHTPAGRDPLADACKLIDPKNQFVAKDYINIVEDARIERMIKDRFPGLRKSFAVGYRELLKRDLFGLDKIGDLKALPLIDRINLQYKIGWLIDVPFSAVELPIVQQVAKTVTWDDVVSLSKAIYDLAKKNQKNDKSKPEDNDESSDTSNQSQGDDENGGANDTNASGNDENDDDDGDDNKDGKSDATASNSDKNDESDDAGDDDSDAADESKEKNLGGADGEDAANPSKTQQNSNTTDNRGGDDDDQDDSPAPESITAKNAENGLKDLVDTNAIQTFYADLPEINNEFVVSLKDARESLDKWIAVDPWRQAAANALYGAWKTQNAGAVQILATEFDRRKAADAHKRTMIAETGSLDPNRLHAYRIADDIFLSNTYVKDGKNHGLILLLDMSGSMSPVFYDTMVQLVTLAHFCRRVNIPFSFYGYTDLADTIGAINGVRTSSFKAGTFNADKIRTRLVTLLQDGMKQKDFIETCGFLLMSAYKSGRPLSDNHPAKIAIRNVGVQLSRSSIYDGGVSWMRLDSTPTNAALLGLPSIMEEFKKVKQVQVMNLVVLTDGEASDDLTTLQTSSETYRKKFIENQNESNSYFGGSRANIIWRDGKTRKIYDVMRKNSYSRYTLPMTRENQTALLLDIIRDRVGGKSACIHLMAPRDIRSWLSGVYNEKVYNEKVDTASTRHPPSNLPTDLEKAIKILKDNGWIGIADCRGFNDYIVIRSETRGSEDEPSLDDVDLTSNSALRDLRKAFTQTMAATKNNRPLLARVADLISK